MLRAGSLWVGTISKALVLDGMGQQFVRCEQCEHEQSGGRWCGRCGSLLPAKVTPEDDAAHEEGTAGGDDLAAQVPRDGETVATRRSTRGAAAGLLAVVVAVAIGWQWWSSEVEQAPSTPPDRPEEVAPEPPDEREEVAPEPPEELEEEPSTPIVTKVSAPQPEVREQLPFDAPTGTALIVDAGSDGAVVLDVDTGATTRFGLPRGDVAEQPYPLLRRGEWLVVAQHGGWALTQGAGPSVIARWLGQGRFAVPATDPEQVWLVDEGDGQDVATWTLLEVTGAVLAQVQVQEGYTPIRGVPAGLAVRDGEEGEVLLYDVDTDSFRPWIEEGSRVLDATADRVITCSDPCQELVVHNEHGQVIHRLGTDAVRGHGRGWLSPEGRLLAAIAFVHVDGPAGGVAGSLEVRIYDVDDGEVLDRAAITLGDFTGSWTPDGEQFFYRTVTDGPPTPLGRYAVGRGFEAVALDVQDVPLGDLVAWSRNSLEPLLADDRDDR